MSHQAIFGPLTVPQFLVVSACFVVGYVAYGELAMPWGIVVALVCGAVAFLFVRNTQPPPFDAEFVRRKRVELGQEKFNQWCKGAMARIMSQQVMRRQRGLGDDPKLVEALDLLNRESSAS
jgi:hypothetical protein